MRILTASSLQCKERTILQLEHVNLHGARPKLVPCLDRVFDTVRDMAVAKANHFGKKPYETLLDTYNSDFTSNAIE